MHLAALLAATALAQSTSPTQEPSTPALFVACPDQCWLDVPTLPAHTPVALGFIVVGFVVVVSHIISIVVTTHARRKERKGLFCFVPLQCQVTSFIMEVVIIIQWLCGLVFQVDGRIQIPAVYNGIGYLPPQLGLMIVIFTTMQWRVVCAAATKLAPREHPDDRLFWLLLVLTSVCTVIAALFNSEVLVALVVVLLDSAVGLAVLLAGLVYACRLTRILRTSVQRTDELGGSELLVVTITKVRSSVRQVLVIGIVCVAVNLEHVAYGGAYTLGYLVKDGVMHSCGVALGLWVLWWHSPDSLPWAYTYWRASALGRRGSGYSNRHSVATSRPTLADKANTDVKLKIRVSDGGGVWKYRSPRKTQVSDADTLSPIADDTTAPQDAALLSGNRQTVPLDSLEPVR